MTARSLHAVKSNEGLASDDAGRFRTRHWSGVLHSAQSQMPGSQTAFANFLLALHRSANSRKGDSRSLRCTHCLGRSVRAVITKGRRACPVCGTLFLGEFCPVCALRGSYGDILVRDRKMYVAPTPFALAEGTAHRRMLILPADHSVDNSLVKVGLLIRSEVDQVVVACSFDLRTNNLGTTLMANPNAGRRARF